MKRIVLVSYQMIRAVRVLVLTTVFGYVSHCHQTPTCGTYFLKKIEEKGVLVGIFLGSKRALTCSKMHILS